MTSMRRSQRTLALALVAAFSLLWFWSTRSIGSNENAPRAEREDARTVARHEAPADAGHPSLASVERREPQIEAFQPVESSLAPDAERAGLTIRGLVVTGSKTGGDAIPLPGYSVLVGLAGAKNSVSGPEHTETGPDGTFAIDELDGRGPWNVLVRPVDRRHGRGFPVGTVHVGSVFAQDPESADTHVFEIDVGPVVVIRSALPQGVEPRDLLVETVGRISPLSSQLGGVGGCAVAQRCPDGRIRAYAPPVTNVMQVPGYGVRITTRDGLFGAAVVREGKLHDGDEIVVDEPLSPRGRVRIEVHVNGVPLEAQEAAKLAVQWSLPLGDPERDDLDLPSGLKTSPYGQPPRVVSERAIEIGDLPVGSIEFTTAAPRLAEPLALTSPVPAMAVHGDPVTVTLLLQRQSK